MEGEARMIAKRPPERGSALIELVATDFGRASGAVMPRVVAALEEDLGAEVASFRSEYGSRGYALEQGVASSHPRMSAYLARAEAVAGDAPLQYGHFDPLRVAPAEQNRVLDQHRARQNMETSLSWGMKMVYEPLGLLKPSHMRVLLTEGPFLLSWLGMWRSDPFTPDEERALGAMLQPIARRLATERLLWAGSPRPFDLFMGTLDAFEQPVLVLDDRGRLVITNVLGRELLEKDRSLFAECSARVKEGRPSPRIRSVTPVGAQGLGVHHVIVVSEPRHLFEMRLARMRSDHGLTAAETRVLAQLVEGTANKDIATKLGCATRTVEVHATAVMRKCHVESRARLVSAFWSR